MAKQNNYDTFIDLALKTRIKARLHDYSYTSYKTKREIPFTAGPLW